MQQPNSINPININSLLTILGFSIYFISYFTYFYFFFRMHDGYKLISSLTFYSTLCCNPIVVDVMIPARLLCHEMWSMPLSYHPTTNSSDCQPTNHLTTYPTTDPTTDPTTEPTTDQPTTPIRSFCFLHSW